MNFKVIALGVCIAVEVVCGCAGVLNLRNEIKRANIYTRLDNLTKWMHETCHSDNNSNGDEEATEEVK